MAKAVSMTRRFGRLPLAAAVLGLLVWRVGSGPFLTGVESIDGAALGSAAVLTLLTTVAAAWRWSVVSRGLGVGLPFHNAVAAYYRSQFLNSTLPGGVLGDVHRGVRYGRQAGDLGGGLRAVAWERGIGQVVQAGATIVVLLAFASPARAAVPYIAAGLALAVVLLLLVLHSHRYGDWNRLHRAASALRHDARWVILDIRAWPVVLITSLVVVAGHTAVFVVAAHAAGVTASLETLLPLAMLVLLVAALPVNIAGWGLREGAAATVFAAADLGTTHGIAAATAFGVISLVAVLPGAGVLLVSALRRRSQRGRRADEAKSADNRRGTDVVCREGLVGG